jgi:Na+/H+-dicarboxylate symporter
VNVPAEGVGILLAVDTIPDMFRTTANVTGSLAVATALASSGAPGTGHSAPGTRHPSPYEGIR